MSAADSTRYRINNSALSALRLRGELLFQRWQHTLLLACFIQLDADEARAL
ncbi:hypothetical protein GCM10010211_85850 [Streptomyces albospinus]|uniref:Uncharacterized protein n=1 Tax=Streptomyces albospinus TaxID=285515 RepID=A0ABQ2VPI7_9ACTN|nr:hypothetical protein [Streptomyces albospinus]GGV05989.1 hypothetical protein GCM10010211_85850 [Streptomyces albospinus]